jgi:hypothetical protein
MFCGATAYRRRRGASGRPRGQNSFGLTWRSSWELTFFTVEVLALRGLVTYYVLLFIHLESRKVEMAGMTAHPSEQWMKQMARNVTMQGIGALRDSRYLLHDRDTKYTASFLAIIESVHVKTLGLPARSPNLNAYFERWIKSAKEECLSKLILFGERSYDERSGNTLRIITLSEIIRGSPTSCRFLKSRQLVVTKL